jgi:hypothetical protein
MDTSSDAEALRDLISFLQEELRIVRESRRLFIAPAERAARVKRFERFIELLERRATRHGATTGNEALRLHME